MAAANKNLEELDLDYVDVLLVHFPDVSANCTNNQNQWASLSDLVKQEKVRALGVSNFCKSSIECLISGNATGDVLMPAVNQFNTMLVWAQIQKVLFRIVNLKEFKSKLIHLLEIEMSSSMVIW